MATIDVRLRGVRIIRLGSDLRAQEPKTVVPLRIYIYVVTAKCILMPKEKSQDEFGLINTTNRAERPQDAVQDIIIQAQAKMPSTRHR